MSDQNVAHPPSAPAAPAHDPVSHIKTALLNNLHSAWGTFVSQVKMLPVHQGFVQLGFEHFENGMRCLAQAIAVMEVLPLPPKAQEAVQAVAEVAKVAEKVAEAIEPAANPPAEAADGA